MPVRNRLEPAGPDRLHREEARSASCTGNGTRRDADVLVCAKLRRYYTFPAFGDPVFVDGICFFLPDGTRIENFPEKHSENCTRKHQETNQWFKHTVRIMKNLRNTMIEKKLIEDRTSRCSLRYGLRSAGPGSTGWLPLRDAASAILIATRGALIL